MINVVCLLFIHLPKWVKTTLIIDFIWFVVSKKNRGGSVKNRLFESLAEIKIKMRFATDEWKICQMSIVYKHKNGSISIHNSKHCLLRSMTWVN